MAERTADATTQVMEESARLVYPDVELRVIEGLDRGMTCKLEPPAIRIGTGAGSHLRLQDRAVSRLHCEIRIVGDATRIFDCGSTNGTYVDGVRVYEANLAAGASVRVGATVVSVATGRESCSVELSARHQFGEVIGASTEMRRLYAILEKIAPTDTTVLIRGETGTGKELVARAIHDASARAGFPFIVVDCGAIAENLIESELFGHVRGAFSGAISERRGLFEEANGGTLFLDEIGELPPALQPRLLRVIESFEVRRVGGNTSKRVDVRVLAATNRSLTESINAGTFREDLYYRLAVVEVELPPLRTRRADIALLAQHFIRRYAGDKESLSNEMLASLATRAWPGNVRELRNFIERSVSLGYGPTPGPDAGSAAAPGTPLPADIATIVPTHLPLKDARAAWNEQFEMLYVKALLAKTKGNVTRAAELAGINRRSLQRIIAGLGLRDHDDAPGKGPESGPR
jgi:transcriptional regulator with PAS, ATPase and Fis domain